MGLGFLKETLLEQIGSLNNLESLQYIGINVYLISLLAIFLIPFFLGLIIKACSKDMSFWIIFLIVETITAILIILTIAGFLPLFTAL